MSPIPSEGCCYRSYDEGYIGLEPGGGVAGAEPGRAGVFGTSLGAHELLGCSEVERISYYAVKFCSRCSVAHTWRGLPGVRDRTQGIAENAISAPPNYDSSTELS